MPVVDEITGFAQDRRRVKNVPSVETVHMQRETLQAAIAAFRQASGVRDGVAGHVRV
ncbi:hypothetical protein OHA37_40670 (plasmid) [Streptomyces sp. NBC_00335]|uniref:hypothetical protein n=1 Tax=unclassified Streptomyces TaxID=2593676 RepID=UPI0022551246|nr:MULTISPECIES: hypothetical protein [unclassified Streptomyces]MCX5410143.1 hypothetical protein [Streptomyces sp. NBC_00086]